jgi:ComF family protein
VHVTSLVGRVSNGLIRSLLAPPCASCDRVLPAPLSDLVCDTCRGSIAAITRPWCDRCGDALASSLSSLCDRCRARPPSFEIARSAGRYEGVLRELLHAFKYGRRRALARPLGRWLRDAGADVLDGADAVVPVPLHPWRRLRRGFNQADDLARELGMPVWRALRRTRHGPPQASLPASRRDANVRGAFVVRQTPLRRHLTVVLIDDVMTTGGTLDGCGQALIEAGVKSVRALTVARAATAPPRAPPLPLHPGIAPHSPGPSGA